MADGRPKQQQSPAIYCGGYCWWAVSAARRHPILPAVRAHTAVWAHTAFTHCPPRAPLLFAVKPTQCLLYPSSLPRQVLVANPRQNRFELYASCAAFSLFQEPFRAALQPAASEWPTGMAIWQHPDGRAAWA
jgi:hypothetical protein